MSPGEEHSTVFRIVEGRAGSVEMELELVVRFDYGSVPPWVQSTGDGLTMVAGSDALRFHSPVPLHRARGPRDRPPSSRSGMDHVTELLARLRTRRWRRRPRRSTRRPRERGRCATGASGSSAAPTTGDWRDEVVRSLITVKALSYSPTGAVIAAATTSLPEQIGGVRNWDYRYSWLRDASLTLQSLLLSGYTEEAAAWQQWLQRAVAGHPGDFQIMYGVGGERRLSRDRARLAPRLRGLEAGADRQRGERAVPARRVRRGAGRGLDRGAGRPRARTAATCPRTTRWPESCCPRCSSTSRRSGISPTTASGRSAGPGTTSPTRR